MASSLQDEGSRIPTSQVGGGVNPVLAQQGAPDPVTKTDGPASTKVGVLWKVCPDKSFNGFTHEQDPSGQCITSRADPASGFKKLCYY